MTSHSLLSPSAAHRWMRCPGSLAAEQHLPQRTSSYADEGTRAHELAAAVLRNGRGDVDLLPDDMTAAVVTYVEAVREYQGDSGALYIEQKVDFSADLETENAFGTADAVIITGDELQIHDLKTGRGVRVEADWNEQLMLYALGALSAFGHIAQINHVRLVIHQPRLSHLSEWALPVGDLLVWADEARRAAKEALAQLERGALPDYRPGEKQCRFCKAKATCPALSDHVAQTVGDEFKVEPSPGAVARALDQVELIEGWCKAVREQAFAMLAEGTPLPGYKLVEGKRGARKWADEKEAEALLKSMRCKVEEMYDLSLISPTSAEKLHKSGVIGPRQWPRLQDMIVQAPGKPAVVPDTDKRPAITVAATADDFSNLGESE